MNDTQFTDAVFAGIALIAFVIVLVLHHRAKCYRPGPDVGAAIFEPPVDEDINHPSLEAIDLALQLAEDDAARDWLLDRRLAAMREAS